MYYFDLAESRIQEPLSDGINFKKLLKLHVSPFDTSKPTVEILKNLKDLNAVEGVFLDWIGILKGARRAYTAFGSESMNDFYKWNFDTLQATTDGELTFYSTQSKPLFFGDLRYYKVSDSQFRKIVKAYCMLTNFTGTIEQYELFFKEVFNLKVNIRLRENDFNLEFTIMDFGNNKTDFLQIEDLTPTLPQTKNYFLQSKDTQISFGFANIDGIGWNFNNVKKHSFTFKI